MIFADNPSSKPHELSTAIAYIWSLGTILVSVLGFFLSARYAGGAFQILLYNIFSAVLSIGVVSFLYELRLRRTVEAEMMRLVGIEKSLSSHCLASAGDASKINWSRTLEEASTLRVLLAEPGNWVQANWNVIIKGGRERKIHLEFFFPKPDGDWSEHIARFHKLEQVDLAANIKRASDVAEDQWKAADEAGDLSQGSTISVKYVDAFPTCSLIRVDSMLITISFPSTSRLPTENGFALTFSGPADTYPINWYDSELKRLSRDGDPQYVNEVKAKS